MEHGAVPNNDISADTRSLFIINSHESKRNLANYIRDDRRRCYREVTLAAETPVTTMVTAAEEGVASITPSRAGAPTLVSTRRATHPAHQASSPATWRWGEGQLGTLLPSLCAPNLIKSFKNKFECVICSG